MTKNSYLYKVMTKQELGVDGIERELEYVVAEDIEEAEEFGTVMILTAEFTDEFRQVLQKEGIKYYGRP